MFVFFLDSSFWMCSGFGDFVFGFMVFIVLRFVCFGLCYRLLSLGVLFYKCCVLDIYFGSVGID